MGLVAVMIFVFVLCLLAVGSMQEYRFRSERRISRQWEIEYALTAKSGLAYLQSLHASGIEIPEQGQTFIWRTSAGPISVTLRKATNVVPISTENISDAYEILLSKTEGRRPFCKKAMVVGARIENDVFGKPVERLQIMEFYE